MAGFGDSWSMSVALRLAELGGVASFRELARTASRSEIAEALAGGEIVRLARGRYALPRVDDAKKSAAALSGVLSHTSAALAWGWATKSVPGRPHVTVGVGRKIAPVRQARVQLHRRDLRADEVIDERTNQDLTLEQCLRTLPFDEALAVADSALRTGYSPLRLRAIARDATGPGAPAIRRVSRYASDLAANPFESVLRAIALEVRGLSVRPQVRIGAARPDLVDERLRLVLEADSFEWHGGRAALRRDAQRYNTLVVMGWTVLRFAWEDVMFEADRVRRTLELAVARAQRRS